MTLVIAQRQKDKISLSSDSRLTIEGAAFDSAIKIFRVPFRLKGPLKSFEDRNKWEFEHHFGVAITGSTVNAYTVKESIAEVLANLQYATNMSDVSMKGIGYMIYRVYEDVSRQLSEIMRERGLSEIIIAGFCLVMKRVRFLRFYFDVKDKVEFKFEEFLKDEGFAFFGSGKPLAEEIYNDNKELTPLEIVRQSVESGKSNSIGGLPQHGFFTKDSNFSISGVSDTIVHPETNEVINKYYLRGISFEQNIKNLKYPLLFLANGYTPVKPLRRPNNPQQKDENIS